MEHDLQDTIALLSRTPGALNTLLRDLPDTWVFRNEGEQTWSSFDVIRHLIYCERADWMPRVKIILQFGESQAFKPFDREGFTRERDGASLGQALDEFARLRSGNLDELRSLKVGPKELALRGKHPSLGVVTLSQLLATWAAHDLTHLHSYQGSWRTSIGKR